MAGLWGVGAALVGVAAVIGPASLRRDLVLAVAAAAAATALAAFLAAGRVRMWMSHVACVAATGMVSLLVAAAGSGPHAAPFGYLFLFVSIFAFGHYPIARAVAHLALVALGATLALVHVGDPVALRLHLPMILGVGATTGAVVYALTSRIRAFAYLDPLTGASNRHALAPALDEARVRARRHDSAVTVAIIDLDGFKEVNDDLGHAAGDQILRDAVAAWSQRVGPSGTLVRLGGDEFAVVLADVSAADAERLGHAMARDAPAPVSACVGLSESSPDASDDEILEAADAALYESKRRGGNNVTHRPLDAPTPAW